MMSSPLPWHETYWQHLQACLKHDRLPHALMITGPAGLGKSLFSHQIAHSLLCHSPVAATGLACGQCRVCRLLSASTHPDLSIVSPLENKKNISVDQIRELGGFIALTAQFERYKVVILEPAEKMTLNAANSLLKTLEEPTSNSLLILVTSQSAQLSATVRSRCQEIRFSPVDDAVGLAWLEENLADKSDSRQLLALANGSPLKALEMADSSLVSLRMALFKGLEQLAANQIDPIALCQQWSKEDKHTTLRCLSSWLTDMLRLSMAAQAPHISNCDLTARLSALAAKSSPRELILQLDRVAQALQHIEKNHSFQLVLEDILIQWRICFYQKHGTTTT